MARKKYQKRLQQNNKETEDAYRQKLKQRAVDLWQLVQEQTDILYRYCATANSVRWAEEESELLNDCLAYQWNALVNASHELYKSGLLTRDILNVSEPLTVFRAMIILYLTDECHQYFIYCHDRLTNPPSELLRREYNYQWAGIYAGELISLIVSITRSQFPPTLHSFDSKKILGLMGDIGYMREYLTGIDSRLKREFAPPQLTYPIPEYQGTLREVCLAVLDKFDVTHGNLPKDCPCKEVTCSI